MSMSTLLKHIMVLTEVDLISNRLVKLFAIKPRRYTKGNYPLTLLRKEVPENS